MSRKTGWIDAIYRVATGSRKIRNFFTPVGALFYGLLVYLFVVIALKMDGLLGLKAILPSPFNILLSLPVFLFALILMGWSVFNFIKARGTPVPMNPPPDLVTSGPYAYVRNPMLAGVFALLFGFSIFLGSISLLFVFTLFFILLNVWELKNIEESELVKRLGEQYVEYRKRTPMFLPRFRHYVKKNE
jgi:protein-S-isoprenylcysteine O-methyltransferase Ste14